MPLISEIVGKCERTALVAPSVYVKSKSYVLKILGGTSSHLNRKPYVKSIDTAFSRRVYIMIQKWGAISEAFKDRIVKLVESGFYRFWEDLIIHVQTTGGISRKGEQAFSQQQLNSNILTIFFILSIAVGPCVVIFLCELALRKRKRIIEGLKVSLSSLVNNFRENSRIIVMQVMSAFLMRQR